MLFNSAFATMTAEETSTELAAQEQFNWVKKCIPKAF